MTSESDEPDMTDPKVRGSILHTGNGASPMAIHKVAPSLFHFGHGDEAKLLGQLGDDFNVTTAISHLLGDWVKLGLDVRSGTKGRNHQPLSIQLGLAQATWSFQQKDLCLNIFYNVITLTKVVLGLHDEASAGGPVVDIAKGGKEAVVAKEVKIVVLGVTLLFQHE